MYLLTPNGIEAKSNITLRFLKSKMQEYELLQAEISALMQETNTEFTLNQKPVTNIALSSPTLAAVGHQFWIIVTQLFFVAVLVSGYGRYRARYGPRPQ